MSFLSRYLRVVEVNSSFYSIPNPQIVESWQRQVEKAPGFKFIFKLWQGFTHDGTNFKTNDAKKFKASLRMLSTEMYGCLLIQFPYRFHFDEASLKYVDLLGEQFSDFKPCFEFRHRSWDNPVALQRFHQSGLTFVNIDQPAVSQSIGKTFHITSNICYVRMHGRNSSEWFNESGNRDSRYNYLYDQHELDQWHDFLVGAAKRVDKVYLIFNNHFRAQAIINALQMRYILEEKKPKCPPTLLSAAPFLRSITIPDDDGQTISLF